MEMILQTTVKTMVKALTPMRFQVIAFQQMRNKLEDRMKTMMMMKTMKTMKKNLMMILRRLIWIMSKLNTRMKMAR